MKRPIDKKDIRDLLHTVYTAGFAHGSNEGPFPKHGTLEACDRLLKGESPRLNNTSYVIKDMVEELMSKFPDDTTK